jgi:hypothetical protein
MKAIARTVALAAPLTLVASLLGAQLSLGLRGTGSFPTGDFAAANANQTSANAAVISGAKNGFGYGLDAGLSLGPIGIYAGFDHVQFDCETTTCKTDGKYTLQGVTAGVKLTSGGSLIRPFVKAGVTFNDLQGGYGGSSSNTLTTDRAPGYEIGIGADIGFAGILSFAPQARYIGQNLKAKIPGVTVQTGATGSGVNYFTFDMGLAVHTPFGR